MAVIGPKTQKPTYHVLFEHITPLLLAFAIIGESQPFAQLWIKVVEWNPMPSVFIEEDQQCRGSMKT